MTPQEKMRIEKLQRALQLAIITLNETADKFLVGDDARHLNNVAAECRKHMHT